MFLNTPNQLRSYAVLSEAAALEKDELALEATVYSG
jgi:hypothetical protein